MRPEAHSYTIVMTACVNPGTSGAHVQRRDPELRLSEYVKAARHWARFPDERCTGVLLLENSGYDLDRLTRDVQAGGTRRPFATMAAGQNDAPAGVHYGYSEFSMLDDASLSSHIWNDSEFVVKVTGRLMFPRLSSLIDSIPARADFVGDARSRRLPHSRTPENGALTTQIVAFSPSFYSDHLRDLKATMSALDNFESHIETKLYERVFPLAKSERNRVLMRFPISCEPEGYGATGNIEYGRGADRLKAAIRAAGRVVAPWVWL